MKALEKVIKENDYKIVHIQQNSASIAMDAIVAKKCGVPVIVGHSHNTRCVSLWQHYLFKMVVNKVVTDRMACSEAAGKWIFGNRHDIKIVNNAIDTDKYLFKAEICNRVRRELDVEDKFVIGYVGRLYDGQKNLYRLLDIFNAALRIQENAVLIMVGDGPDKEGLIAKVNDLHIENRVKLLGKRDDVNELMMAMDVFLMPSLYEGLPVVIVESQATGLRCVISDKVPAPDLIGNIEVLSLNKNNNEWAESIISKGSTDRTDARRKIIAGNYDIAQEAKWLQEFYLNRVKSY